MGSIHVPLTEKLREHGVMMGGKIVIGGEKAEATDFGSECELCR